MYTDSVTPTITAGAYSAGEAVGGKLTFEGMPEDGLIKSVTIVDLSEQGVELNLALFHADFTGVSDNAAFDISAADAARLIGNVNIPTTAYKDLGGLKVATVGSVDLGFKLTETSTTKRGRIFAQLSTLGTPTYTAVDDITVVLSVSQ